MLRTIFLSLVIICGALLTGGVAAQGFVVLDRAVDEWFAARVGAGDGTVCVVHVPRARWTEPPLCRCMQSL